MSVDAHSAVKRAVAALCDKMWEKVTEDPAASYEGLLVLWREAHGVYLETAAAQLAQWAERYGQAGGLDQIEADVITVEVIDKQSGKIFRRSLPVKYRETGNGVVLSGETMTGQPSQIALLSDTALAKMQELFGQGPDAPRCGNE